MRAGIQSEKHRGVRLRAFGEGSPTADGYRQAADPSNQRAGHPAGSQLYDHDANCRHHFMAQARGRAFARERDGDDGYLHDRISRGSAPMPAWGRVCARKRVGTSSRTSRRGKTHGMELLCSHRARGLRLLRAGAGRSRGRVGHLEFSGPGLSRRAPTP